MSGTSCILKLKTYSFGRDQRAELIRRLQLSRAPNQSVLECMQVPSASPQRMFTFPSFRDVVAGLSVALILVPQAIAYADLAGLPPAQGLFAATLPLIIAAIFGSSPMAANGACGDDQYPDIGGTISNICPVYCRIHRNGSITRVHCWPNPGVDRFG